MNDTNFEDKRPRLPFNLFEVRLKGNDTPVCGIISPDFLQVNKPCLFTVKGCTSMSPDFPVIHTRESAKLPFN